MGHARHRHRTGTALANRDDLTMPLCQYCRSEADGGVYRSSADAPVMSPDETCSRCSYTRPRDHEGRDSSDDGDPLPGRWQRAFDVAAAGLILFFAACGVAGLAGLLL